MAITTNGLASGLDTAKIISELMSVESQPLQKLNNRKASYQAKVSSYGTLASSLTSLRSTLAALKRASILSMAASSSDTSVFTATASTDAATGAYSIKVNNLASAQSLYSGTFSSATAEVADLSSVATQKLRIQVGSASAVDITITAANNSLTGIKDAINAANAGVAAQVLYDGANYKLTLSATATGAANHVTVKADENNNGVFEEAGETDATGLSQLAFNATYDAVGAVTGGTANLTQSQAAVDAALVVNGLTITRAGNVISDIAAGVTVTLLKDSAGKTLTLTVSKDADKIKSSISAFVGAYNNAFGFARSLSIPAQGKSVILTGDATTSAMLNTLQNAIVATYAGRTPASFGLAHDRKGVLQLDAKVIDSEIQSRPSEVVDAFDAMATALEGALTSLISEQIPARTNGLQESSRAIDKDIANLNARLARIQQRYEKTFAAMEQALAQLQSTSNFLTQRLGTLGGAASGSSGSSTAG